MWWITESHVMSMALVWEPPCWKNAMDNGGSCIGIRVRRAERQALRRRQNPNCNRFAGPQRVNRNKTRRRKIMKTVSRMLMLFVLGVVLVTPLSGVAQKTQPAEKTLIGYEIGRASCRER